MSDGVPVLEGRNSLVASLLCIWLLLPECSCLPTLDGWRLRWTGKTQRQTKTHKKTAEKLMKGRVSSVQQTLDVSSKPQKALQDSDQEMWQSHGSGSWHTKEMLFWRGFEWVGLSIAFCQPGDPGSDPSSNSDILGLSIGECSISLCRTQSGGYQSLQPYLWPCRG